MLRIGTDCSGIEAPIQALKNLGIPFSHEFSSDIDKYCIQSIKANYEPKVLFGDPDGAFPGGDITTRDIKDVPDIDLYVCGFPCQPFSAAGKRTGLNHKSGNVFWGCLDVIRKKRPKYFILENVKGLLSNDKGKTWTMIWGELSALEGYTVEWKILNTKDYGIPHNRERLFIVGVCDATEGGRDMTCLRPASRWPMPVPSARTLAEYVDREETTRVETSAKREKYLSHYSHGVFIEFNRLGFDVMKNSYTRNVVDYVPCICTNTQMWCIPMHRFATCRELLDLQGFSETFRQVVSSSRLKTQTGNSMSVNVIEKIIRGLIVV
jgi:DNA (cytosine-5)-methyltransferase 1